MGMRGQCDYHLHSGYLFVSLLLFAAIFAFVNGFGLEKNIPSEVIHPPHSSTFFVVVAKFHAEFAF